MVFKDIFLLAKPKLKLFASWARRVPLNELSFFLNYATFKSLSKDPKAPVTAYHFFALSCTIF